MSMSPTPLASRLRFEVLRRDQFSCRYCGRRAPEVALEVDHVQPKVLGGSDDPSNLVTSCSDCNRGKASTVPESSTVAEVVNDQAAWTAATRAAAELQAVQRRAERQRVELFDAEWTSWTYESGETVERGDHWEQTIRN